MKSIIESVEIIITPEPLVKVLRDAGLEEIARDISLNVSSFKNQRLENEKIRVKLFHFGNDNYPLHRTVRRLNDCSPLTIVELAFLAREYPNLQKKFNIFAVGTRYNLDNFGFVNPFLTFEDRKRKMLLYNAEDLVRGLTTVIAGFSPA
jgi:hypothetical protein